MLSTCKAFWGSSPEETYDNITLNIRQLTMLLGITNVADPGLTHEIIGTHDVLVAHQHYPRHDLDRIKDGDGDHSLLLFTHPWTTNNPESFNELQPGTSVWGINLPLLAACNHKATMADDWVDDNHYLTEVFSGSMYHMLWQSAFNSLQYWVEGEEGPFTSTRAPYQVQDVSTLGKEAASEIKAFYHSYKNTSPGNLASNLFGISIDRGICVPDLKDFYNPNMQWVGMYLDREYHNRLKWLDGKFELNLNLDIVEKQARRMVNPSRLNQLLMAVPSDIKDVVKETYFA
jgi:hypothetical protein